jgi:hypothetical protein
LTITAPECAEGKSVTAKRNGPLAAAHSTHHFPSTNPALSGACSQALSDADVDALAALAEERHHWHLRREFNLRRLFRQAAHDGFSPHDVVELLRVTQGRPPVFGWKLHHPEILTRAGYERALALAAEHGRGA